MGSRPTKKMTDPRLPTAAEIDENNKTHLPYRNWCSMCAKGRGKEMPHRKATSEHLLNDMHVDFTFGGSKDLCGETTPCPVVRERLSRMTMAASFQRLVGDSSWDFLDRQALRLHANRTPIDRHANVKK